MAGGIWITSRDAGRFLSGIREIENRFWDPRSLSWLAQASAIFQEETESESPLFAASEDEESVRTASYQIGASPEIVSS
jgi:hypothetical protein